MEHKETLKALRTNVDVLSPVCHAYPAHVGNGRDRHSRDVHARPPRPKTGCRC